MMTGNIMDYLEWYGDFDFQLCPSTRLIISYLQSSAMQVLMV